MESNIACFHVNLIIPHANCKHAKKKIIKSAVRINASISLDFYSTGTACI